MCRHFQGKMHWDEKMHFYELCPWTTSACLSASCSSLACFLACLPPPLPWYCKDGTIISAWPRTAGGLTLAPPPPMGLREEITPVYMEGEGRNCHSPNPCSCAQPHSLGVTWMMLLFELLESAPTKTVKNGDARYVPDTSFRTPMKSV